MVDISRLLNGEEEWGGRCDGYRCATQCNVDPMIIQGHHVTLRDPILSGLLLSSQFSQAFLFEMIGR